MSAENLILLTGSANIPLAEAIGKHLGVEAHKTITRFADNEARVQIPVNVRKKDVFIVQPTCPPYIDNHYIELFGILDAARRASASDITAIIPYFGYSRQDRKDRPRTSITAATMAQTLEHRGANRILTVDLHNEALQGTVRVPWDNLYASYSLMPALRSIGLPDIVVASPDEGGFRRAVKYSELLGMGEDVAIVYKRRDPNEPNKSKVTTMIGNVRDRDVLLVDDIFDTGGTMTSAARYLKERESRSVRAGITHALFSNNGVEKLNDSPIDEIFITDSVLVTPEVATHPRIRTISIAPLLAEAILCIQSGESISERLIL